MSAKVIDLNEYRQRRRVWDRKLPPLHPQPYAGGPRNRALSLLDRLPNPNEAA